jgi:hypothetical protein
MNRVVFRDTATVISEMPPFKLRIVYISRWLMRQDVVRATNRRPVICLRRRIENFFNNVCTSKSMVLLLQVNGIALRSRISSMTISGAAVHGCDSTCFMKKKHHSARFIQQYGPRSPALTHHPVSPMGSEKLWQCIERSETCNFFKV